MKPSLLPCVGSAAPPEVRRRALELPPDTARKLIAAHPGTETCRHCRRLGRSMCPAFAAAVLRLSPDESWKSRPSTVFDPEAMTWKTPPASEPPTVDLLEFEIRRRPRPSPRPRRRSRQRPPRVLELAGVRV
ncbi:MAG: hypothetical protein ACRDXX_15220 [Stackebrandtia sp.]